MVAEQEANGGGPRILVEGAVRRFRLQAETIMALDGADLVARSGTMVCIHGPSGSGKTTLLNCIAGLDRLDEGRITVDGVDVAQLDTKASARMRLTTMGVVFQGDGLIEEFTAVENVTLPLEASGQKFVDVQEQAVAMLKRVGVERLAERLPRDMSGGQRQRVGIARALIGGRSILVLDEPTAALDRNNSRQLFATLAGLRDEGTVVVVCSHDPLAAEQADVVYEMVDGRLHIAGSTAQCATPSGAQISGADTP